MAISVKTNENYGFDIMKLLGVPQALLGPAEACGIQVTPQGPGKFAVMHDGKVYGVVPVPGSAISLAKNGTLGPASKQTLSANFTTALQKALATIPTPAPQSLLKQAVQASAVKPDPQSFASQFASQFPPQKPMAGAVGGGPTVHLKDATKVLQPVHGTSPGSIYYTYLILDGAAVAIRVKGKPGGAKNLSIRAEGPKLKDYAKAWDSLDLDDNDGYYSGHFNVADESLLHKTLGALAGSIGFSKVVAFADPSVVCSL